VTRPPKLPLEFGYVNGLISLLAEDLNHHPQTMSSLSQND
jgi:pterin-4a-carbinolamine dehydratase